VLAAPRAPVPAGCHEVPVRGDRLSVRRPPVAEQPPLARSHLEEAEVLAVLRSRRVAGLTPRDSERLTAVAATEDAADCDLRRCVGKSSRLAALERAAQHGDRLAYVRETPFRARERAPRDLTMLDGAEERAMVLEETDDGAVPPRSRELVLEPRLQGNGRLRRTLRSRRIGRRLRALPFRYRRDLCGQNEHAQANEQGFQDRTSLSTTGARPAQEGPLVSRDCGSRYTKQHELPRKALQNA